MVSFVTFSSEDGYDKLWLKNYWKFRQNGKQGFIRQVPV
jgi:hypothetical protein